MPHSQSAKPRFRFLVTPITTSRVDVETMSRLAKATDAALRTKARRVKLAGIVLFPMVTEEAIYARSNFIIHKRASNAFYVGQNIDFNVWKRARRPRRFRLALRNFRSSVEAIPERHLSSEERRSFFVHSSRQRKRLHGMRHNMALVRSRREPACLFRRCAAARRTTLR